MKTLSPRVRYLLQSHIARSVLFTVCFVLASCGGQDNSNAYQDNGGTATSSTSSTTSSSVPTATLPISSVNGSESFLPSFGVGLLSDGNNAILGSGHVLPTDAKDLAEYEKNAAQQAVVTGFIVKYKDGSSNLQSGFNANSAGLAPIHRNGNMTTTAMANSLSLATAKYGLSLKFKAHAVGNATALYSNKKLSLKQAQEIAASLKNSNSQIAYVDPDIRMQKSVNDTRLNDLWSYQQDALGFTANVVGAWEKSTGLNTVVAVVDTGIIPHQDLVDNTLPGADMISTPWIANDSANLSTTPDVATRDNDASDTGDSCDGEPHTWHGSHVAGIIAAKANNNKGIAGVAYNAKILPIRVLGRCGGDLSDVAAGIVWAVGGHVEGVLDNISANKAKIINLSLGASVNTCLPTMKYAIDYARAQGAVVVVAAGNDGANAQYSMPANCASAITVGATGATGNKASFSNFGPLVDISAPGENILSTVDSELYGASASPNAYAEMSGTSMAAPHVSGIFALMLALNPNLSVEQAETAIKLSSRSFVSSSLMAYGGVGIVNAAGAVNALATPPVWSSGGSFNADNQADFLWRNQAGNFTQLSLMAGPNFSTVDAQFENAGQGFTPSSVHSPVALQDFNADDKTDIVWKTPGKKSYQVFISYMNGALNQGASAVPKVISNSFNVVSAAVYDGATQLYKDGKNDLYFRNNTTGEGFYCFTESLLSSSFICSAHFTLLKGLTWLASADFNNDGNTDMLFRNPKTGAFYIAHYSDRITLISEIGSLPVGEVFLAAADYDGDGLVDLLFRNSSTATLSVASNLGSLYLNLSSSTSILPSYKTVLKAADYNGDGKDDLVVRDNLNGVVSLINLTFNGPFIQLSNPTQLGVVRNFFIAVF